VLSVIALIGVLYAIIQVPESGWSNAEVQVSLAVGLVFLACFAAWELHTDHPMLDVRFFRNPRFSAASATITLISFALVGSTFLLTQYFQFALGYSPLQTGLRLLPWTATPFVVAPIAGILSDRIGRRPLMVVGLTMQGTGLAWVAGLAAAGASYAPFVLPLLIAGVGISMAIPIAPAAVVSAVAPADMGKASGVNSTLQRFGSAFAVAIAAAVFSAYGHIGTPASFTSGFRPALLVVATLSILAGISALAIGSRRPAVVVQPVAELAATA
jgi:MFS family permease